MFSLASKIVFLIVFQWRWAFATIGADVAGCGPASQVFIIIT